MDDNPLHAAFYADKCVQRTVTIAKTFALAKDTWLLRLNAAEIARSAVPGQFVMLRLAGCHDPLIGRPLAVFDTHADHAFLDVVYVVKGKLTTRLAQCTVGQEIELWGPLGNGFSPTPCDTLIMVGGGIGFTPFLVLARESLGKSRYGSPPRANGYAKRVVFCYGARTAEYLTPIEPWEQMGVEVRIATDDGSRGYQGLVTDVLRQEMSRAEGDVRVVCCGPEPMMAAVAQLTEAAGVACEVSLETPMACGIGVCFTCVAQVRDDRQNWDYQRTCVAGPVFDSRRIVW